METRAKDLTKDAKGAIRDIQESAKETASEWGEKIKAASQTAKDKAQAAYQVSREKTIAGAQATDRAIRENPYASLGIAFGCGVLIGWLITRED
jgi:ElaB/YqjD/DUF883 family membrane-anchored ribosome-binding protein